MKFLIIKTLHICINTTNNIKNNTNYDNKSGTRNQEINISRTKRKSSICTHPCHQIWKYCYQSKKSSNVKPTWVLHGEIRSKPLTNCSSSSGSSFWKNLPYKRRKCNNSNSKDNRYHTSLIDSNRKIWTFISTCTSIDKGNLAISFCKANYHINHSYCKRCYNSKKCIILCWDIIKNMLWNHRSIIVPAVIKAIAGKTTPQKLVVSMIGAAPPVPTIVFKRRIIP